MSRKMMEISVIIPTHNRADDLKEALESIYLQKFDRQLFEVIIVDNGPSTDGTQACVASFSKMHDNLRYIRTSRPGVTRARELGDSNATGRIHLQIDDDTILPDPETFTKLINSFEQYNCAAITGLERSEARARTRTKIPGIARITPWGVVHSNYSDALFENGNFTPVDHVRTCFLAYTHEAFLQAGGYDCRYDVNSPGGFRGETDFCYRLNKIGRKIFLDKRIRYIHKAARRPHHLMQRGVNYRYMYISYLHHALFVRDNIKKNKFMWLIFQFFKGDYKVPGLYYLAVRRMNPLLLPILLYAAARVLLFGVSSRGKK